MILRFPETEDIAECVEIGREFWHQTPYASILDYNPEAVANLLQILINDKLMVIAEYESEIVGVAGIVVTPFHFDPSIKAAAEMFWYVRPGVRDQGVGESLLAAMEAMAKRHGASIFSMGNMQTTNPEDTQRLLEKNGYRLTEKSFAKVL